MSFAPEESLESLTDDQLMARIREGEMEPLGILYTRYEMMVRSAIRRTAPELPFAEVEELTQDAFLAVARGAKKYRGQAQFRSWLYGIAMRKARLLRRNTSLRNRLIRERTDLKTQFGWSVSGSSVQQAEFREAISKSLADLKEDQRTVLLLHVVEGMTSEAIAEVMGIRPKTVRTRLHRARKKLLSSVYADGLSHELGREES